MSDRIHSWPRAGLQALSVLFLAIAIAVNLREMTAGLDGISYWIAVASVVALELGVWLGAACLFPSMKRGVAAASLAAALAGGSAAYASWNAASFVWTKHEAVQLAQQREIATLRAGYEQADAAHRRAIDRATAARGALLGREAVRATADVRRDINQCGTCKSAPRWRAELERAEARDGLVSALTAAEAELALHPKPAQLVLPNHGAPAAKMLNALTGVSTERSELAAALLFVLLLQLSSPLCMLLSGALHTVPTPATHRATPDATSANASANAAPTQPQRVVSLVATRHARVAAAIVAAVAASGGSLETTTRALAQRVGVSHRSVAEALREAGNAGALVVRAGRRGTTIALA